MQISCYYTCSKPDTGRCDKHGGTNIGPPHGKTNTRPPKRISCKKRVLPNRSSVPETHPGPDTDHYSKVKPYYNKIEWLQLIVYIHFSILNLIPPSSLSGKLLHQSPYSRSTSFTFSGFPDCRDRSIAFKSATVPIPSSRSG